MSDGRIPWWLFDAKRRVPGTRFREYLAPLGVFLKGSRRQLGAAMRCEGPLYERLWRPLLTSALNTDPPESSAALTAALMRETLAAGGRACHPLFAAHGLAKSFIDPALAFLTERGGASASATGFERSDSRRGAPSGLISTARRKVSGGRGRSSRRAARGSQRI